MSDVTYRYLARLEKDHIFFLRELWKFTDPLNKAPLGDVELDIFDWVRTGPQYCGVLAPRSTGKTHVVTAASTACDLFLDPQWKVKILSKTDGEAKKTVQLVRRWLSTVPFLRHLVPQKNTWQKDSERWFHTGPCSENARDYSLHAQGIESQITGGRAHVVYADDIETKTNTRTLEARTLLDERIKELKAVASFDTRGRGSGGRIVDVGTFHHEESVYIKLSKRGYTFRTWSLEHLDPEEQKLTLGYAPMLADKLARGEVQVGDPTMPHRFGRSYINDRKAEGKVYYAQQYKLIAQIADEDRYPLRLADFILHPCHPHLAPTEIVWGQQNSKGDTSATDIPSLGWDTDRFYRPIHVSDKLLPYTHTHMRIDPAGRGKDKLSIGIVGHLHGVFFIKHVSAYAGGATDTTRARVAQIARSLGVNTATVEGNFGGDAYGYLFQTDFNRLALRPGENAAYPQGWGCVVDDKPSSGQKELRIIGALEPALLAHRVVIDPSAARNEDLQHQLTRITRDRDSLDHDDEIEVVAAAIADLNEMLRIDPTAAAADERDSRIQAEIDEAIGIFFRQQDATTIEHGDFFRT
jgi:hypothetical protein